MAYRGVGSFVKFICRHVWERTDMLDKSVFWASLAVAIGGPVLAQFGVPVAKDVPIPYFVTAGAIGLMFSFAWRAYRLEEDGKPVVDLSFEPKAPWIERPTASYAGIINDQMQMGETESIYFRVMVRNQSATKVVNEATAFLTAVEIQERGDFVPTGFGASQPLPWANVPNAAYAARDIREGTKQFVDVVSVTRAQNKIAPSWPVTWNVNHNLFALPATYRITVAVTSKNDRTSTIRLCLKWTGQWDQTEMWIDQ